MRLLLAEDEKALSRALVTILEHNNYSVDPVYNGQDAIDYLQNGDYDGAILDVMMPKLDGISVLKRLRSGGSSLPVLMLTAKAEVDDRVLGLDSGADDYLPKPFDTKELLARLRAMLRRRTETAVTVLRCGNLALDTASYELKTDKGSFRLANKEYQMMELLMSNPGQIISAERFMEKIWGCDSDAEINVVWVYISYLRKKLDTLGSTALISAKRNSGYLLEVRS